MKPNAINRIFKTSQERHDYIKKFCERPYKVESAIVIQPAQADLMDEFARFQTSLDHTPAEQTEGWPAVIMQEIVFG